MASRMFCHPHPQQLEAQAALGCRVTARALHGQVRPQERQPASASAPRACPGGVLSTVSRWLPLQGPGDSPSEFPAPVLRLARQGGVPGLAAWHPGTPRPHHSPAPSQDNQVLAQQDQRSPARPGISPRWPAGRSTGPRWRIRAAGPAPRTAPARPQSPRDNQGTPVSGAGDTPGRCAILWRSLVLLWHKSFVTASAACLLVSGSHSWAHHLHLPLLPPAERAGCRGAAGSTVLLHIPPCQVLVPRGVRLPLVLGANEHGLHHLRLWGEVLPEKQAF